MYAGGCPTPPPRIRHRLRRERQIANISPLKLKFRRGGHVATIASAPLFGDLRRLHRQTVPVPDNIVGARLEALRCYRIRPAQLERRCDVEALISADYWLTGDRRKKRFNNLACCRCASEVVWKGDNELA